MNTRIILVTWFVFLAVPLLHSWTVDAGGESPPRGQEPGETPAQGVEPVTQSVHPEYDRPLASARALKAVRRDDAAGKGPDGPELPLHIDVRVNVRESIRERLRQYGASLCLDVYPNAKPALVRGDCEESFLQEEYGVRVARAPGPEFRFTLKNTGIRISGSFPDGQVLALGADRPPPGVALQNREHAMGMQEARRVADAVAARLGEEVLSKANLAVVKSGYSQLDETYYFEWRERTPKHLRHCGRSVRVEVRKEDGLVTYVRVVSFAEAPKVPFERAVAEAKRASANSTHGFSVDRVFLDVAQYYSERRLVWCYAVPAAPGGGPRDVTKWDAVTGRVLYSEVVSGGTEERPYHDPDFFAVPTENSVRRDIERRMSSLPDRPENGQTADPLRKHSVTQGNGQDGVSREELARRAADQFAESILALHPEIIGPDQPEKWQAFNAKFKEIRSLGAEIIPRLCRLAGHENPRVRRQALGAIPFVEKGSENAIEMLINSLADRDPGVRFEAAEGLGHIGRPGAHDYSRLFKALHDEDPNVRVAAAQSLAALQPTPAELPKLIAALENTDPNVRRLTAAFLPVTFAVVRNTVTEPVASASEATNAPATLRPAIVEPKTWTAWSEKVNDLQFRFQALADAPDNEHWLPIEIEIKNVGEKELYVLDPAKISGAETTVRYYPLAFFQGRQLELDQFPLDPSSLPGQYVLIEPGKSITARCKVHCRLPREQIELRLHVPSGWFGEGGIESLEWKKENYEKIDTKAWRARGHGYRSIGSVWVTRPNESGGVKDGPTKDDSSADGAPPADAITIDGLRVAVAPGKPVFERPETAYLHVTVANTAQTPRYLGVCPAHKHDEGQKSTSVDIGGRREHVLGIPCYLHIDCDISWDVRLNRNGYSDRYRSAVELKPGEKAAFRVAIPTFGDGRDSIAGRLAVFSRFAVAREPDGPRTVANGPESAVLIVDRDKLNRGVATLREALAGKAKKTHQIEDAVRAVADNPAPEHADLIVKVVQHPWPSRQHIEWTLWFAASKYVHLDIYRAAIAEAKDPQLGEGYARWVYRTIYRNRAHLKRSDVLALIENPRLDDAEFTGVNNNGFWPAALLALVAHEEDIPALGDLCARFILPRISHDLCHATLPDRRLLAIHAAFMRHPDAAKTRLREALKLGTKPGEFAWWAARWLAELKDTKSIPLLERYAMADPVSDRNSNRNSMQRHAPAWIAAIDGPEAMRALRRIGSHSLRERAGLGDPVAIDSLLNQARMFSGNRWDDTGQADALFAFVFSILNPDEEPSYRAIGDGMSVNLQWERRRGEFVRAFVKKYGFDPDVAAGSIDSGWSKPVNGLRARVLCEKTTFDEGEPIEVTLELQCFGEKDYTFPEEPLRGCQLFPHVNVHVGEQSKRVRLMAYNRVWIGKGKIFRRMLRLSELVALDKPGEYAIRAGHSNGDVTDGGDWTGDALSPPVTITVVQTDKPRPKDAAVIAQRRMVRQTMFNGRVHLSAGRTTFEEIIETISRQSGVRIQPNWVELEKLHLTPKREVSIQFDLNTTPLNALGNVLTTIGHDHQVGFAADRVVYLSSKAEINRLAGKVPAGPAIRKAMQRQMPLEKDKHAADLLMHLKPRLPRGWKRTHVDHGVQSPIGWKRGEGTFLTIENEDDSDTSAVRLAVMDAGYAEKVPEDSPQTSAIVLTRWRKRLVFVHGGGPDWPGVKSDVLIATKLANESRYPGFQATPPPDRSADRIEEADIDEFLEKLGTTVITDRQSFLALIAQGKRVFYKGRPVSEKQFSRLIYNAGSIGTTFEVFITSLSPRSYPGRGYGIHLEVSSDRRIVDFYWEYPIEPDADSVPVDQLWFFHRHLERRHCVKAIHKGWEIFAKGRKLPPEFLALFKTYYRGPSKDGDRYCFVEGTSASAWLWIDRDTRTVNSFSGGIQ